ncbi:MAG: hypothetical protein M0D55_01625 [Elusimicrobiota bacterium]|nr:MAG: hypothetical protein M0D55_01625 [Elusimicrobiota bacterium]
MTLRTDSATVDTPMPSAETPAIDVSALRNEPSPGLEMPDVGAVLSKVKVEPAGESKGSALGPMLAASSRPETVR